MNALDKFVEKVRQYITRHPGMTEDEIIRYVYIKLGKKLSFDENFKPSGDKKTRKDIYIRSKHAITLIKCMETNTAICSSMAHILRDVLTRFGVKIIVVKADDGRSAPHTYNIITPKDGRESYIVDLQEDSYLIKMHAFTKNYGLSSYGKYVISRFEQETMDRKQGYIDDTHYYTDDYIYMMKADLNLIENFNEKVKFILENIEVIINHNINYPDRKWFHAYFLENFFDDSIFDHKMDKGLIRFIDYYKLVDGKRVYFNIVTVANNNNDPDLYIYNRKEHRYTKIDLVDLAIAERNGLIKLDSKQVIKNLGSAKAKVKQNPQLAIKRKNWFKKN